MTPERTAAAIELAQTILANPASRKPSENLLAQALLDAARPAPAGPEFQRHPFTCEWCAGEWPSRMAYEDHFGSLTHKNPDHPYQLPGAANPAPAGHDVADDLDRIADHISTRMYFQSPIMPPHAKDIQHDDYDRLHEIADNLRAANPAPAGKVTP